MVTNVNIKLNKINIVRGIKTNTMDQYNVNI